MNNTTLIQEIRKASSLLAITRTIVEFCNEEQKYYENTNNNKMAYQWETAGAILNDAAIELRNKSVTI